MSGGPPRAVWHITWDELGKGGKMPSFDAIANYLKNVDYCPHIMWDPWTGKIVQFYPADQSARALANRTGGVETNRAGSVCLQIEVFFSPGAVVDGKRYDTVAETPCKGLDAIVAWMRSWGVPDRWPSGVPQWSGNSRSSSTWLTKAGHYGHCHVPENDHTDPGPMPRNLFTQEDDLPSVKEVWTADIIESPPEKQKEGNKFWTPASYLIWGYRLMQAIQTKVGGLEQRATTQDEKLDKMATDLADIKALLTKEPS